MHSTPLLQQHTTARDIAQDELDRYKKAHDRYYKQLLPDSIKRIAFEARMDNIERILNHHNEMIRRIKEKQDA